MLKTLLSEIVLVEECKAVFLDINDLVSHRVNRDYTFKLWAKYMIRELGIDLTIDELLAIRKKYEDLSTKTFQRDIDEIPYQDIINEIYTCLVSENVISGLEKALFSQYFKNCQVLAEIKLKEPYLPIVNTLKVLGEKGYSLYCLTSFTGSTSHVIGYLKDHNLQGIFKDVLVYSEYHSEINIGSTISDLLIELKFELREAICIGTNLTELLAIAEESGIPTVRIEKQKETNENILAKRISDQKKYRRIVRRLYRKCNGKEAPPYSDYILFYYVFIERLYKKAKKDNTKNIFFLAREGLFLKKLFEYYQNQVSLNKADNIKAHYFKASRKSLMLASLKDIEVEEFDCLRRRSPNLSVNHFLQNFNFTEEMTSQIIKSAGLEDVHKVVYENFLDSEIFTTLKKTPEFIKAYYETLNTQKAYFTAYLDSFDIDVKTEGIHLCDVGWVGSMQNRLYKFFENNVKVHGYYLGLRQINNITKDTMKYGLNFSVYPNITFFDHILMGNIELNEQLLAAGHGSTIAYTSKENGFTIEYFEENERKIYNSFIKETQDFMFSCFKELTKAFYPVCYDYDLEQYEMADHSLRVGLFASKRKVTREVDIYKGFYQSVGNFSVGLSMGKNFGKDQKLKLMKDVLFSPEEAFRYILRFKPMLLRQKKYTLAYLIPSTVIYHYIKLRCHSKGLKPRMNIHNRPKSKKLVITKAREFLMLIFHRQHATSS